MPSRTGLDLERGERLRYRGRLRPTGEIAVTDRRLLIDDEGGTSVHFTDVSEVAHESFDWFLAIMSGALVAFGVYSLTERPLLGLGFAVVGLWSLRRTHRHRDQVRIHTHSRPKPLDVYPADVDELFAELEPAIEAVREERTDDADER